MLLISIVVILIGLVLGFGIIVSWFRFVFIFIVVSNLIFGWLMMVVFFLVVVIDVIMFSSSDCVFDSIFIVFGGNDIGFVGIRLFEWLGFLDIFLDSKVICCCSDLSCLVLFLRCWLEVKVIVMISFLFENMFEVSKYLFLEFVKVMRGCFV